MPVPGSLKRRPVDDKELANLLERQFEIKPIETRAYLRLLEGHDMTLHELAAVLDIPIAETQALMERMLSSGLVIRAPSAETKFAPLHPRMTMTNIFKIYEKRVIDALRDHRTTVDRVVNMLIPIYEERKIHSSE
jgi:sugar-specific transcriptional regulator TrmB